MKKEKDSQVNFIYKKIWEVVMTTPGHKLDKAIYQLSANIYKKMREYKSGRDRGGAKESGARDGKARRGRGHRAKDPEQEVPVLSDGVVKEVPADVNRGPRGRKLSKVDQVKRFRVNCND